VGGGSSPLTSVFSRSVFSASSSLISMSSSFFSFFYDCELLDKQMRMLTPPRNDGVIVVLLAAMFLIGMTLGSVPSEPKTDPVEIASTD
jgi:hypothetical protein